MNTYTKLQMHLQRHVYKRGQYKGDAPLDGSRRGRSHLRVVKMGISMVVRMHGTDILTAYPDGRIVIDTNGWSDSSTTRMNLNYALAKFNGFGCIYTQKVMGLSQPVFRVGINKYHYYDGMKFDESGKLLSAPKPFEMRRIDKDESKEFMQDLKLSGFKDMFSLLYATATLSAGLVTPHRLADTLTNADRAVDWPDIISAYKYHRVHNYKMGQYELLEKGDAKSCWANIMKECKKGMYVTLKSTITVL